MNRGNGSLGNAIGALALLVCLFTLGAEPCHAQEPPGQDVGMPRRVDREKERAGPPPVLLFLCLGGFCTIFAGALGLAVFLFVLWLYRQESELGGTSRRPAARG